MYERRGMQRICFCPSNAQGEDGERLVKFFVFSVSRSDVLLQSHWVLSERLRTGRRQIEFLDVSLFTLQRFVSRPSLAGDHEFSLRRASVNLLEPAFSTTFVLC
jgi:hypothetical protein